MLNCIGDPIDACATNEGKDSVVTLVIGYQEFNLTVRSARLLAATIGVAADDAELNCALAIYDEAMAEFEDEEPTK